MPFENKIMKLITGVKTRKEMSKLFKYFKDNNIDVPKEYVRTAMNKWSILPEDGDDTTT